MKALIIATLSVGITISLLGSSLARAAGPGCPSFDCGTYVCTDYVNGEWTDATGTKVLGAYVFSQDAWSGMQLMQTDNGYASGNPVKLISGCERKNTTLRIEK
jgi:hypothetical protein